MNFGRNLWLKFSPFQFVFIAFFFYDFTCYLGGYSGSSFLCIVASLAARVSFSRPQKWWSALQPTVLFETGLVCPCLYLKWRGKYFVLCVVWLEDAAYFFGMIAGDVSRCFTWPRVTGAPWFLHLYFAILLHFLSSLNKVGVLWILVLRGGPASLHSESSKIDCVYCWTWRWGDDEHSCT